MQIYKWDNYVWFFSLETRNSYTFYKGRFLGTTKDPLLIGKEMTLIEKYQHKEN